jgi:hypothetical protein
MGINKEIMKNPYKKMSLDEILEAWGNLPEKDKKAKSDKARLIMAAYRRKHTKAMRSMPIGERLKQSLFERAGKVEPPSQGKADALELRRQRRRRADARERDRERGIGRQIRKARQGKQQ